jgi:hypothetical protein
MSLKEPNGSRSIWKNNLRLYILLRALSCMDVSFEAPRGASSMLQDFMQHLSPRVCTILGSWARLHNNENDWAGSMFRWFDLCKCYNEVVDGSDRAGLGLRLSDSGATMASFIAKIKQSCRLKL